ncbi:MAG TPA: response regulator [Myxococcota bacterium]|jgi:DNA-binding NtrC family response regulator|nr:response regulator [Myxococcota bacterium]
MARDTVLLVEDDAISRKALAALLAADGYAVIAVASGWEALAVLEARTAASDLVVADLGLPGGPGAAVVEALRARHTDLPVLVLTGCEADDPVVREQVRPPLVAYAPKPVDLDQLTTAIAALLARRAPR